MTSAPELDSGTLPLAPEPLVTGHVLEPAVVAAVQTATATATAAGPDPTKPDTRQRPAPSASSDPLETWRPGYSTGPQPKLHPRRRGAAAQRCRRIQEQRLRCRAVDVCHWLQDRGGTLAQAADLLDLQPRTLRHWAHHCHAAHLQVVPLGRPARRSPWELRMAALDFLKHHGPNASLPTLQQHFPAMARAELDQLRHRYRRVLHLRYHDTVHVLHWQKPGRVWALDFAQPSDSSGQLSLPPVDGLFPYLLAVRDLASGYTLAWLPLPDLTTDVLLPVLGQLFARQGAPLVLKSDNGSAFRAEHTLHFLEAAGVIPLFSPPHWPRYNGAIEAGIGSLKTRTNLHAARHGRTAWAADDLSAACHEANLLARFHGRTPSQAWLSRADLTAVERACFRLAVDRQRFAQRTEQHIALDEPLDHWRFSALDRQAVPRALVEHGYLLYRRRRIPLQVRGTKVTRLS
jgi:transposase InsO family protein